MDRKEKLNSELVDVLTERALTFSIFYRDKVIPTRKEKIKSILTFKGKKQPTEQTLEKKYIIYPATFGKLQIMAKFLSRCEIDYEAWEKNAEMEVWKMCEKHTDDVCRFIAVATMNDKAKLINPVAIDREAKFIKENGQPEDFTKLMVVVLQQCDLANFTMATLLTKTYKLKGNEEKKIQKVAQRKA